MRKNNFFNMIFLVLSVVFLIVIGLAWLSVYPFNFALRFWFELFLMFMAIAVLMRGILFRSDSSIFAGIILFVCSILFSFRNIFSLAFLQILPGMLLSLGLAAIVVYLFFKNRVYLKMALVCLPIMSVSCFVYLIQF